MSCRVEMLTLTELMVFIHQLITVELNLAEMIKTAEHLPKHDLRLELNTIIDVRAIMRPEMVKVLLAKIEFSPEASDDNNAPIASV